MNLPTALVDEIQRELRDEILDVAFVGGGCISNACRLQLSSGGRIFLKWAGERERISGMFREEARSLHALGATSAIRVPKVLHVRDDAPQFSCIILEWLEPGGASKSSWRALGKQLATLHRKQNESYGWPADNFIGSLPQANRFHARWSDFWRAQRLQPQIEMAAAHFSNDDMKSIQRLLDDVDSIVGDGGDEGASLLHGDLWSGNVHMLADSTPALIDPSTYYGHREVDLAMSRLFGGFDGEFYRAYEAEWPLTANAERRLHVYQLYYLLVHVNLFGGSYVNSVRSAVKKLGF